MRANYFFGKAVDGAEIRVFAHVGNQRAGSAGAAVRVIERKKLRPQSGGKEQLLGTQPQSPIERDRCAAAPSKGFGRRGPGDPEP